MAPPRLPFSFTNLTGLWRKRARLDKSWRKPGDLAPRVKLSALGVEIELDLTSKPKTIPEDQILLLGQYLDALSNAKSPTFIVFDEFQEVARTPDHEALIAALRAALVRHAGGFATVFSGSSQSRLRKIFNSKSAPFYRFATPLSLPPLGIDFVRHQLGFYPQNGPEITEDEAMEIFRNFGTNPDYFQRWMRLRAVSPDQNAHEVARQISAEIADEFDFEASWLDLADTHRLVLRLIASGLSAIYGDEAQSTIMDLGVADPPTTTQLQTAFKTLERRDLVDNWEGERQIADPMFRSWILSRPDSDFQ